MVINAWSCNFVQLLSCCSPARNISPHISLHDLPYHRIMKRCLRQVSPNKVAFPLLLQRSWIQTNFCICPQNLCLFLLSLWVQPKYTWSRNDVGSPKSTSFISTFFVLLPLCVHCCLCIRILSLLGALERTCAQDCDDSRIESLSSKAIFMTCRQISF